jgi:hypothetical protein
MSKKDKPATSKQAKSIHLPIQRDWNIWIIMGLAVILYGVTFGFDFVLDDEIMTRSNAFVNKGIAGIRDIFTHGTLYGFNGMNDQSYRPLMLANFALEKSLFKGTAGVYHFFNVFYHALASGLFYVKKSLGS